MEKTNEEVAICSKCGQPIPNRKKMPETENCEQACLPCLPCLPCLKQFARDAWLNSGMDIY